VRDSFDDITYVGLFTVQGFGPLHDGDVLVRMPKRYEFALGDLHCTVAFVGVGPQGCEPVTVLTNRLVCYVSEVINRFRVKCF